MSNQNNNDNDDKKWINDVGIVATSKKSGNPYIEFKKDIVIKAGDRLTMKKRSDSLQEAFEAGRITQKKYEELLEKTGWIKYELTRPPRTDKK